MRTVRANTATAIAQVHHELLACGSFHELAQVALPSLAALFGAQSSCWGVFHRRQNPAAPCRLASFGHLGPADMRLYEQTFCGADPVLGSLLAVSEHRQRKAVILQRLVNPTQFESSDYYREFLRPREIHFVLGMLVPLDDDTRVVLGVHRSRRAGGDFGEQDIEIAHAVVPGLSASISNAFLRERVADREAVIEALARCEPSSGTMALDEQLAVTFLDTGARELLRRLCREECRDAAAPLTLPSRLKSLLTAATQSLRQGCREQWVDFQPGSGRRPLRLTVQALEKPHATSRFLVSIGAPAQGRTSHGTLGSLTCRQVEIAELVARGMSNVAIARGLHLSVRTVENHLRSIYCKLDVRNRGALGRIVGAALG